MIAVAAPRSIEELVSESDKWPAYAEVKTPMTIEGRLSSLSRQTLRMKNCDLPFHPQPGKELPRLATNTSTVELSGRMVIDMGKPAFEVEMLRGLLPDIEESQARGRRARKDVAEDWHAIGRWAATRAAFYKDDELAKESEAAYLKAIDIERRAIPEGTAEGFFTLATKSAELKLPDRIRQELVYEGSRRRWDIARAARTPALDELREQLGRDLAGSGIPLQPPAPSLEEKSAKSPLATYRDAPAEERLKLHRIFYAEVTLAMVVARAQPDGSNGMAVGDEIERLLPEKATLAETWRERELQHRLRNVATAGRQEMRDLAEQFRKRNRPADATKSVTAWLEGREAFLRKDGPDGLKQLAEEYFNLLKDEKTAAKFLIEAHTLSPQSTEIAERLETFGYRFKDGKWLTAREVDALPQDPIVRAISDGHVIVGMTPEQVRRARGLPTSVTRVATLSEVCEVWTYDPKPNARTAVHFVRKTRSGTEPKVTAIVTAP